MFVYLQIIIGAYVWFYFNNESFNFDYHYFAKENKHYFQHSLVLTLIIPIIFFLSVMSLLHFHAYLACKGLTTFEWILRKRQRNAQQRLEMMKRAQQKQQQMQNKECGEQKNQDTQTKQHHSAGSHSINLHEVAATTTAEVQAVNQINDQYERYHAEVNEIAVNVENVEINPNSLTQNRSG